MVQTSRGSATGNPIENDPDDAMPETIVLITYAVGTTQHYSLLLSDVYNVADDKLDESAFNSIISPLRLYDTEIVQGWTMSQVEALGEAMSRNDAVISLRCNDGIEIKLGSDQTQLETTKRQFKIAALGAGEIQLIVRIKGFLATSDVSPNETSDEKFTAKHSMTQFVHTRHVVLRSALPIKAEVKTETKDTSDEAFSMEERINAKDLHKIDSIKLTSRSETLDWYDNLALHGAMYGVFVPPSGSIAPHTIMGTPWSKKLMGATIHGRRSTMESHLYKVLLSDGLFPTECREEYLDIVKAARGDGYAALHNILRMYHPRLTEQIVEVKYMSQTVSMRFGEHVKLVQQYIDREDMRGRTYTQYEGLQLVLRTLHVNYRVALTKRVADEFGVAHDRVSTIPFTVRMSQRGISLLEWADELGLHSRSASRVTFVGQTLDFEIHALPKGQKCRLCGQDGHLDQTCHRFANHVIGDKLMRDNAALEK
jgi:hypothetical protein